LKSLKRFIKILIHQAAARIGGATKIILIHQAAARIGGATKIILIYQAAARIGGATKITPSPRINIIGMLRFVCLYISS